MDQQGLSSLVQVNDVNRITSKIESRYVTKIAGADVKYFGKTYKGAVDLGPTLTRIEDGKILSHFKNDGVVFENVDRVTGKNLLPTKKYGYYTEHVVPTAAETGPGTQRIIAGKNGERYYTPDHYKSFIDLSIK